MSHRIEDTDRMFYAGEKPWHGIGTAFAENLRAEEAYAASGCTWPVLVGPLHDHRNRPIPNRVTIYRQFPVDASKEPAPDPDDAETLFEDGQGGYFREDVLGDATDLYTPIANRVLYDVGQGLIDAAAKDMSDRGYFHTGGSLRSGREVYCTIELPSGLVINGQDKYETFLLVRSGHDGGTGFGIWITRVRVVCGNTLDLAMRGRAAFRVEHYGDAMGRVAQATKVIYIVNRSEVMLREWMEKLVATPVKPTAHAKLEVALFGKISEPDPDESITPAMSMQRNQRDAWAAIYEAEAEKFGATAYTELQAVTGFADWRVPVRKRPDGDEKMIAMFDGVVHDKKWGGIDKMIKTLGLPKMPTLEEAAVPV